MYPIMNCSVVIPAYNANDTVEDCIKTCLGQSLQPNEIIIVDDFSTDNTWATLQILRNKYSEIPIICVRNSRNLGVAATRNVGIKKARYKYVALLDCDDTWHPEKISICSGILEEHPTVSILYHDFDVKKITVELSEISTLLYHNESLIKILISNKFQGSSIFFRNGLNIFFDPTFRYAEDLEFGIRYIITSKVLHLNTSLTILNRPQLTPGGLSSNRWKMRIGELKAIYTLKNYNVMYLPLIPFLLVFSLIKHLRKSLYFLMKK